jgi:hypothetical protein
MQQGHYADVKHSQIRKSAASRYEATYVQNKVALALISRLHRWCCQLFWLTLVCLLGYNELNANKRKTLQDVRRNIFNVSSQRRGKTLTDLEMQVRTRVHCCC